MADMMQPGPPPGQNPMQANRSILNPADAAADAQEGNISADMTVRDFLAKMGVDVDGPVSQLIEAFKGQQAKAGGMGKIQALSGGGQPPGPPPGGPMGGAPPPGMDSLMQM